MVLEVLFELDATGHDGGELHVVHRTAAGVRSEALFHSLFCDPADAGHFRSAGQVISFLGKNAWLLIVGVAVFLFERFKKRND